MIPRKRFLPSWVYRDEDGKAHYGGFSSRHLAYLGLALFGLSHPEIAPLLEGLDHAIECKSYVYRASQMSTVDGLRVPILLGNNEQTCSRAYSNKWK